MGQHLIHSQILDLRYKDEGRAKAAINQWSDRFQKEWLPVLEQALDELDTDGKWIRLDRVEINLGKIGEGISPELFQQKLKESLKTQLLKQISTAPITLSAEQNVKSHIPHDETKSVELLDYLLRNGHRPWWASQYNKEGIRGLIQSFLAGKNPVFYGWIRSESFTPAMLSRLELHLNGKTILKLISMAFSEKLNEHLTLRKSLIFALSPEVYSENKLGQKLDRCFLEAFLISETKLSDPISKWLKAQLNRSSTSEEYSVLLAELIPGSSKKEALEKMWSKWTHTTTYKNASQNSESQAVAQQIAKAKFYEKLPKSGSTEKAGQPVSHVKIGFDETFPISNAGLVLAAPYLPFFFKGLGLVEDKQFVSIESQNRAALLIQAFLDDSFSYEESDLLLNKILCGLAPTEPISVTFSPTQTEREEIANLLDAMAGRWTAVKGTSGSSMARSFFPREGSLKRTGKGYNLAIPRISIDILLNKLPWTISMIKLPWMNELLFTEW
ncbi:contractile injection system tape measure protein [Dyadobacter fanqingshengii]|uniref:Uncharacterized protein n=1 Tax=Dyadobacter fanqingshengii TaxID=2906443 RepID=A0A9X1P6R7_9BACT|nr:contractile injection system tape measure protein [Dyadobacter fanqingshengii]MCF0039781.1 hypothetical protein [Dyadobacter fanqingshengii]USJ38456.1 contractile injection system tape measure protein [Dyadobacter fanqingshengii]